MYKLLLVDDEEEERKGILNKIEWQKCGYEVVGEAENGIEALEIAEKIVPDVVITDIKMPFMDGLTLCQKLREKYPNVKLVILTGFDQFEYAQRAIKLDVVEYILKPISSKELTEVLKILKNKMDEEIAKRKDIEILKEYYQKSLPILKQMFLCSLISNRISYDEMIKKSEIYGINLKGNSIVVSIINLCFNLDEENEININNKEFIRLGILELCKDIIEKYQRGVVFINEDNIVIILSFDEFEDNGLIKKIMHIFEDLRQSIKKFYGISCIIGIGSIINNIENISISYKDALSAIGYSSIVGDKIIYIQDVEPQNIKKLVFDELKQKSLINSLKLGSKNELIETLEGIFKEIIELNISYKNYYIYLLDIINTILKVAQDFNIDIDKITGINYDSIFEVLKIKDINEVKKILTDVCIKIKGSIVRERQNSCRQIVQAAVTYINENYNDSELSIDKICKVLHVSPAYFSTIFKKETKYTFLNYLTHVRMEAAKELLRKTDYKTLEIAKMVGYSEPNYFSYCFKKKFNISPSEYRNSL